MTAAREGTRHALTWLNWIQPFKILGPTARRYASTGPTAPTSSLPTPENPVTTATKPSSPLFSAMSLIEKESALATPPPQDRKSLRKLRRFNPRGRAMARRYELPGARFQYHPPKYDRGPLHPVQSVLPSDPTSRQFVPGPFNLPRIKQTYHDMISQDILALAYNHRLPGHKPKFIPRRYEDRVPTWDGSSPYHENRGPQAPRGKGDRLALIERDISFTNIPQVRAVAISCYVRNAEKDRDAWFSAWTALRQISGRSPWNIRIKHSAVTWKISKYQLAGVKTMLQGDAAWEFIDKLIHIVLPRIKDWPGLRFTTGDGSGNIQLGLTPTEVSQFPELAAHYDMYPSKHIPGMRISVITTAQSDRQAKLLFQALGMPFTDIEFVRKKERSIYE